MCSMSVAIETEAYPSCLTSRRPNCGHIHSLDAAAEADADADLS